MLSKIELVVNIWLIATSASYSKLEEDDWLIPYKFHHGPRHSHRHIRSCQNVKYGNTTHEITKADSTEILPVVTTKHFIKNMSNRTVFGHISIVRDPAKNVAVLEPGGDGGCNEKDAKRATVLETASSQHCLVAVNAGFFNTTDGRCYGNVISDGKLVVNYKGIQNAHFGIKKDGSLLFGYVNENEVTSGDFVQLVGGVIWIVRNGEVYVNESKTLECSDVQETGTLDRFVNVLSARTAVGHDSKGNLIFAQVEGRTLQRGQTLWEFANMLIDFGVVNAINLDGGGSATYVGNNTLINYPSDNCGKYRCARKVSTAICVRDPTFKGTTSGSPYLQYVDRPIMIQFFTVLTIIFNLLD